MDHQKENYYQEDNVRVNLSILQHEKENVRVSDEIVKYHIVFVLDSSCSMLIYEKFSTLKKEVVGFLSNNQNMSNGSLVSVILFNQDTHVVVEKERIDNIEEIKSALEYKAGRSNFSKAFYKAHEILKDNDDDDDKKLKPCLIFLSDGMADSPFVNGIYQMSKIFNEIQPLIIISGIFNDEKFKVEEKDQEYKEYGIKHLKKLCELNINAKYYDSIKEIKLSLF